MKSRVALAIAVAAAPLAVVGACTFPDVTFGPGPDAASPDRLGTPGSETGTGSEASSTVDASDDRGSFLVDGEAQDAIATRDDGSAPVEDASICETRTPCDCDQDGFLELGCDGGPAGWDGGDCDDRDPLRHPGQDYVAVVPPLGKDGDWNCDGHEDHGYPEGTTWCTYDLTKLGCHDPGPGYNTTKSCGQPGDLYNCTAGVATCSEKLSTQLNVPQACR